MSNDSNPGNATPASLHALYKNRAAIVGNPCTMRRAFGAHDQSNGFALTTPIGGPMNRPSVVANVNTNSYAGGHGNHMRPFFPTMGYKYAPLQLNDSPNATHARFDKAVIEITLNNLTMTSRRPTVP